MPELVFDEVRRQVDREPSEEDGELVKRGYVHPAFLESIEQLRRELTDAALREKEDPEWAQQAVQSIALAASTGLLGVVMRASTLAAIGASAVPLWQRTDPLSVLSLSDDQRRELELALREAEADERNLDEILHRQPEDESAPT